MNMIDESENHPLSPPVLWGLSVGIALFLILLAEFTDGFAGLVALILFAVLAFAERNVLARTLGLLTVLMAILQYTDPEPRWTLVMVTGLVALLAFLASSSSE